MYVKQPPCRHLLLIFAIIYLVFAGTPVSMAAPTSPGKKAVSPVAAQGQANWKERWEKTLAAAKTEGVVTIYTSAGPSIRDQLAKDFQNLFGIRLEFVVGAASEITGKIVAERRAGLNLADVFQTGPDTVILILNPEGFVQPLEPILILPEVTDGRMWIQGAVPYYNKDRTIIGFLGNHFGHVLVNNEQVKGGQITSYFDFLKPEWKEKIVIDVMTGPGPGRNWLKIMGGVLGYDTDKLKSYLQQLSAQKPVILTDRRLEVEWISRGKYPVLLGVSTEIYFQFKALGSPISYLRLKEGSLLTASPGTVSVLRQSAHPNGAIVFVNWLLSKEGQSSYIKTLGSPSARLDVPTTGIDPAFLRVAGQMTFVDNEEMGAMAEKLVEIAKQTLASQLK